MTPTARRTKRAEHRGRAPRTGRGCTGPVGTTPAEEDMRLGTSPAVVAAETRRRPDTSTEAMGALGTRPDTSTEVVAEVAPAVVVAVAVAEDQRAEEPAEGRRSETLVAAQLQVTTGCLGAPVVPPAPACLPISPAGDCRSDNRS